MEEEARRVLKSDNADELQFTEGECLDDEMLIDQKSRVRLENEALQQTFTMSEKAGATLSALRMPDFTDTQSTKMFHNNTNYDTVANVLQYLEKDGKIPQGSMKQLRSKSASSMQRRTPKNINLNSSRYGFTMDQTRRSGEITQSTKRVTSKGPAGEGDIFVQDQDQEDLKHEIKLEGSQAKFHRPIQNHDQDTLSNFIT